jgi:nanoRNase/pAp phosphatase (c-di-AMP/oligoRNAs hydrolase)
VSAIAKSFGGGGHNNAAGFQLTLSEGRELVDRVLNRVSTDGIFSYFHPGGCVK